MPRYTKARSDADAAMYRSAFSLFADAELRSSGPDPHIPLAAKLATGYDTPHTREVLWRAGCYVGVYTVYCAEAVWQELPWEEAVHKARTGGMEEWVRDHWKGITMRNERRAVKSVPKLAEHLSSLALWVDGLDEAITRDYGRFWDSYTGSVRYVGRYAAIKYLETARVALELPYRQVGIQPAGAWSPRLTLSFMFWLEDELLNRGGDRPHVLRRVDELAESVRFDLANETGRQVSDFQVEVLLCNFRQALKGRYPGRSHDSELKYRARVAPFWEDRRTGLSHFFEAREELFDDGLLGEKMGWSGPREELGDTYQKYGYFWSDYYFDYNETTDLANPVRKTGRKP